MNQYQTILIELAQASSFEDSTNWRDLMDAWIIATYGK